MKLSPEFVEGVKWWSPSMVEVRVGQEDGCDLHAFLHCISSDAGYIESTIDNHTFPCPGEALNQFQMEAIPFGVLYAYGDAPSIADEVAQIFELFGNLAHPAAAWVEASHSWKTLLAPCVFLFAVCGGGIVFTPLQ